MSFAYIFKTVYKPDEIFDLAGVKRPFLAAVPKTTTGGLNMTLAWEYARPAQPSNTFSVALANQFNQSVGIQLTTQASQKYNIYQLDSKQAAASMQGDPYAYVSARKHEMDRRIDDLYTMLDIDFHGAGNGIVGTISAVPSGTTLTLAASSQMNRFMVGQTIAIATNFPTDGTPPTLSGWSSVITGVNFQTRTLTVGTTVGVSANQYVVFPGDTLGFSATNQYGNIIGMGAWVPPVALSGGDNFLGVVNRNNDVARLSGMLTNASGQTAFDAIMLNMALVYEIGGGVDMVLMNPTDYQRLAILLQTQVRYESTNFGAVSFENIRINGVNGQGVRIFSDPHQPRGQARLNTMDTWEVRSIGELVQLVDDDGNQAVRDPNADSFQIRNRSWPQLICHSPKDNGVVVNI